MTDLEQLGRELASLRVGAGWDQSAAAQAVGISRITLSRYENGRQRAPADVVKKLRALYREVPIKQRNPSDAEDAGSEVSRGTNVSPRNGALPSAIRLRENEIERELIEAGATDEQVRDFRRSVRESPLIAGMFRGGAPSRVVSEAEMQLYEGVAIGFKAIVELMIKERREKERRR